jgi:excisionase family DNA binding protein
MTPLLNANAVAKVLGISRRTLDNLLASGAAPRYLFVGRQRRWRPEDVDKWTIESASKAGATVPQEVCSCDSRGKR